MASSVPFHPLVARWFGETFAGPTPPQLEGWKRIASGVDTLIAAPTGSGKTLTAFLWALDGLVRRALAGTLEDRIAVVYVSPLKALGNDIEKNLRGPLEGIRACAAAEGLALPEIRVAVRSGDTPAAERQRMVRQPPHVLITTPESLYILLTATKSRKALALAETVIVDEIHAIADDKRGTHLALSLERLDALAGRRLQRIGLSATQKPIEEVGHFLTGTTHAPDGTAAPRPVAIVDVGHKREIDLTVETTDDELGPIPSHELRGRILDRICERVGGGGTTIVFVNTRRLVERIAHELSERLGEERVAAHHGSLSRETRLAAEEGLKSGRIPVVVATASLELGIDVGHVDLVCHLGSSRSIATLLQRVGRSGHALGEVPKGIVFPMTRDDLLQAAAAVRAVRQGTLDRLEVPENARDVLAQQIVAMAAAEESEHGLDVEELWTFVRRASPYRSLARKDFDDVLDMLADGVSTHRGRRSAHVHFDRVNGRIRPRRGARLAAITSGGAIPDTADYDVVEDPAGTFVGKVNEDFAIESVAGDIFLLGNRSWRIRRVEAGRMRVEDAHGLPPTIPFWIGESPGRTLELSEAVADLRREVAERRRDFAEAVAWLEAETGVDRGGAEQIVRYVGEGVDALGAVPTTDTIVAERFFDEAGGMQLVVHAPFGARRNRAFGLALRKRFCVSFDFELQAAATDDGIVISLGEQHSFPLDSVFSMVRSATFEKDLVQAALPSPMFTNRWRWNATRALALLRHTGGKRVPMPIQRMRADDLLAAVFPAQAACQDNRPGPVEPIDHPLVNETIDDCLHEAMDVEGLRRVLLAIEDGSIRTVAVETSAPSPFSHELLNANPYAFLDDAPLEERRARAVSLRRMDPTLAAGLGALDAAAIAEVRRQAWPEIRSADELHDALLGWVLLPLTEVEQTAGWGTLLDALRGDGRVTFVAIEPGTNATHAVAAENLALLRAAFPDARLEPEIVAPPTRRGVVLDAERFWTETVRGWMDVLGPIAAPDLARRLGLPVSAIEIGLARLEMGGSVLRGSFTGESAATEWCERGLLARIHRLTLGRLRSEIEPVSPADLMRFLLRWQHVQPGTQLHGRDGVLAVIRQLEGLELPAPAWERDILPARVAAYRPEDLEQLCLAGVVTWGKLAITPPSPGARERRRSAPTRAAPIAFALREDLDWLFEPLPESESWREALSAPATEVLEFLSRRGASFQHDVIRGTRRLPVEVEEALWELVASGLVTGDGIAGLRALLSRDEKPRRARRLRLASPGRRGSGRSGVVAMGRWSLLRPPETEPSCEAGDARPREAVEAIARQLLARWGVVFRELLVRERHLPPWRAMLGALRTLEARGEIRGGRFVQGMAGEQFALPEAVDALRAVRRRPPTEDVVLVPAADPLNLLGIVLPGARLSPYSTQVIVVRDGAAEHVGELGEVRSRLSSRAAGHAGAPMLPRRP